MQPFHSNCGQHQQSYAGSVCRFVQSLKFILEVGDWKVSEEGKGLNDLTPEAANDGLDSTAIQP